MYLIINTDNMYWDGMAWTNFREFAKRYSQEEIPRSVGEMELDDSYMSTQAWTYLFRGEIVAHVVLEWRLWHDETL